MKIKHWLNLQLFAGEGTGSAGTGDGSASGAGDAATVANPVDDGQQRLRELGVPEDKLRKRAKRSPTPMTKGESKAPPAPMESKQTETQAAAANDNPTEENKTDAPARMSWDEIMADPEYNKQMQRVVQSRLRSEGDAAEKLGILAPALELLARKHGIDPEKMDYTALSKAISDDNSYYENKALEMGVPVETAKRIDQQERDTARTQREQARTLEQQRIAQHYDKLNREGAELKKTFPSFDLQTELKNPAFLRMTSPNIGISVADAYYAVHRNEIQSAAMQVTAQRTAEKIANSIQAGARRPAEAGTSGQAPSVTTFDYSKASREQREAFKKDLQAKWARGEKVYPGRR